MKSICRRLLAALLTLALLAGLAPAVFAAEPDAAIATNAEKDLRYLALDDENNGPHDLYYQQKIMNPVTEDAFVLWYSGKNTNYPISWTSSDPELIRINDVTHMAELTRIPDKDVRVTLTASMAVPYARNSSETYEMTKALTVLVPCPATRLQMDCDALTIRNPEDVRENLPLVKQGKYGASIAWTSSDPAVVSDDSPDNALYDGGVVTRPACGQAPAPVTLTAELTYAGRSLTKTFELRVSPMPAQTETRDHYLFVCYAENYDWNQDGLTTEEIYFGLSDNGLQWKNINVTTAGNGQQYTQPILRSTVGDMGVRDPHIVRSPDGDKFYVLATNLHAIGNPLPEREGAEFKRSSFDCVNGNRDLVIWETSDLTDWGEPRLVPCNFASAGDTYAPEAVWDENAQAYLVYWASKDNAELNSDGTYKPEKVGKVYCCYTRDFNTFSRPQLWLSSTDAAMKNAFPNVNGEYDIYDTTIQYDPDDGLYYRFGTKNRLYVQTSASLSGPWSDAVALPGTINNSGVEAPTAYRLPDGKWMLLGDNYRQYVPYQADHLADFLKGSYKSTSFQYASNGPRYKHGTILSITQAEYDALMTAYDNTLPVKPQPAQGEGCAIDYEAETFSISEGYEVRADSATGPVLTGGSVVPWMGRTLFVRREAGDGERASEWTQLPVPQRPAAPEAALRVCRAAQRLTVCNEADYAGCVFSIGGQWQESGVFDGLTPGTDYVLQVRTPAAEDRFASECDVLETATCAADGACVLRPGEAVRVGETLLEHCGDKLVAQRGEAELEFRLPEGTEPAVEGGLLILPPGTTVTADGAVTPYPNGGKYDLETLTPLPAFVDVPADAYYREAVAWAAGHDPQITTGTDETHFSPEEGCTRAQVVTFLWRADGKPGVSGVNNPFQDVAEGEYYYDAVLWAVEKGITTGTEADRFSPEETCTRAQIVTFLWRYEGKSAPTTSGNPFKDVPAGEYYTDAVLWAVGKGITKGTEPDAFSPNDTCTRAQIVTFLYRDKAA